MRTVRRLAAIGCALLLSACAGMGAVPSEKVQGIKRVGIISAIGDQFEIRKIGFMVFGNDLVSVPIEWGIDDLVIARARALLSRRFEVRPITYQRSVFASLSGDRALSDALRASASAQGVDAYVVVTKAVSQFGTSNQYVAGIGVVGVFNGDTFAHALYAVSVIDPGTFERIGFSVAPSSSMEIHGPNRRVDQTVMPTGNDAAQVAKLKGTIVDLIEQSLPEALRRVQLAD